MERRFRFDQVREGGPRASEKPGKSAVRTRGLEGNGSLVSATRSGSAIRASGGGSSAATSATSRHSGHWSWQSVAGAGAPPEPSTWAQTTTPGPSSAVSSRAAERASAARISGAATTRLCESRAKAVSHIPTRANSPLNPCRFRSPARRSAYPPVLLSPRLAGRVIKSTRARRALPCEASSSHLLRKCSQSVRMQHVPSVPRARDAAQILRGLERRGRRPNLLKKLVDRIYRIC